MWVSDLLDAFSAQDQAAYIDFLVGAGRHATRALDHADLVVVTPGSPQATLAEGNDFFPIATIATYDIDMRTPVVDFQSARRYFRPSRISAPAPGEAAQVVEGRLGCAVSEAAGPAPRHLREPMQQDDARLVRSLSGDGAHLGLDRGERGLGQYL